MGKRPLKRIIGLALLALWLICCGAQAVSLEDAPAFIAYGDCGPVVGWLQDALGVDEHSDGEPVFGDATRAVLAAFQEERGLAQSECFDGDTLVLLLELICEDEAELELVWVPMHGGQRFHPAPEVHNMLQPRQMPRICAEALGFSACGRCY